jgi:hypothetical protein
MTTGETTCQWSRRLPPKLRTRRALEFCQRLKGGVLLWVRYGKRKMCLCFAESLKETETNGQTQGVPESTSREA